MNIEKWFERFPMNARILEEIQSDKFYPKSLIGIDMIVKISCILALCGSNSKSIAKFINRIVRLYNSEDLDDYLIRLSKDMQNSSNEYEFLISRIGVRYTANLKFLLKWIIQNDYSLELNDKIMLDTN